MILKFMTKRDVNGNRKTLVIDTDAKTYARGYNPFSYSDYIEITNKARRELMAQLDENGFVDLY